MTAEQSGGRATAQRNVWIILMGLTLLSFGFAEELGWPRITATAAFIIAAVKADLVIVHYMEVKQAEPNWQPLYRIWTLVIAAALIGAHTLR